MAISLHTNYANLVTQNNLNSVNKALTTSMERLSTGLRINSAADDAAGLQIANRLEAQSRGMSVGMRNSQDAISMMQTAEGSMDEMTNMAYRMKDLATQAANGTNSDEDIAAMQSEFSALAGQLEKMQTSTSFGGKQLLGSTGAFGAGDVTFQIGSSSADTLTVNVATELADLETAVGDFQAADLLSTNAATTMDALDSFIGELGAARSAFGAQINNLEHNINNLANMVENVDASKGRIMDTDFAKESGVMSKNQMLMQAGAQMLSATKMMPQLAMSMLG
ncbi:lateral flagellin LafA [Vibrio furnissii]|uniref:lateral flagellin LafA n=1 Tax=Vibrio furnissii TaxID=29494 RepID=UPI0001B9189E|nr:lateral flagellin LafA [Vibrio furnissii]EEX41979.1 flagellin protein flaA [Vibrio furnissii CIP 102972]QDC92794.1 Lateral flagellin [Vibrio furnissii]UON48576.1 lateral flagellin LafA [Vibrio furnissii]SUP45117.1 lateral flagellin [Vibrio furnissii]